MNDTRLQQLAELKQIEDRLKAEQMIQERLGWLYHFNMRQRRLIQNCRTYVQEDPAGMPGHALAIIISKMADLLNGLEPEEPVKTMELEELEP